MKKALDRNIDKDKDSNYLGFVQSMLDKGNTEQEILSELGASNVKSNDFVK